MPPSRFASGFLSTRVGRRTLLAFLVSAMLPAVVLAVVGIQFVRATLIEQAFSRVERQVKSVSMLLLGRLSSLADEFAGTTSRTQAVRSPSTLSAAQRVHLDAGGILLEHRADPTSPATGVIVLVRRLPDGQLVQRLLPADSLWRSLDELIQGEAMGFCILEVGSGSMVRCSPQLTDAESATMRSAAGIVVGAEQRSEARGLMIAHRDLFLGRDFGSPSWRVVLAEPRSRALAPATAFSSTILVLLALALVSAFALGHREIRLSTKPLEALRDATRRVADGDLETPVRITSADEYGELGATFNVMTRNLAAEFALRSRLDSVDDAALQDRRVDAIVAAAIDGCLGLRGCLRVSLLLLDEGAIDAGLRWSATRERPQLRRGAATPTPTERSAMVARPPTDIARMRREAGGLDAGVRASSDEEYGVELPLYQEGRPVGAICLGLATEPSGLAGEVDAARRIADRAALGLANVRLLERLDLLSSGTLRAFARAIDANSPWTAGHSERVTQLAMSIARQLQLPEGELAILHRGALMHDVGKISVPPGLLDKAGPLTVEERHVLEQHPVVGESILAPISAFAESLAIVRSHHERIDGRGYPDGLAGEAIPWLARILAVADTFDALVSDRPYRSGLSRAKASQIIAEEAGTQLDSRAVAAFLELDAAGTSRDDIVVGSDGGYIGLARKS